MHFPISMMGSVKQGTVSKEPLQSVKTKAALGLMVSAKINDASAVFEKISYGSV